MTANTAIVFLCVVGGAALGLFLRSVLPPHHLSAESKDVIKLGTGVIGTMTGLLLGMQIGSAKDTYDIAEAKIKEIAAKFGLLDRAMANYGSETKEARQALRAIVAGGVEQIWSRGAVTLPSPTGEAWYRQLQGLFPDDPVQAAFKAEAVSLATEIARIRWLMFAHSRSSGSTAFFAIVVFWLALVFTSFGLLGTPNVTVIVTLLVCALSVSGAIGLIMELNRPFGGVIQVSSEPL